MTGRPRPQPSNKDFLSQIIKDFSLFIDSTRDTNLLNALIHNRSTVEAIVEHYLDNFKIETDKPDFKGTLNFMTHILPAIMISSKSEEWFTNAYQLIKKANEAHQAGDKNLEAYWADESAELWSRINELRKSRKKGGGMPQTPDGDGTAGGPGSTPIAQAKDQDTAHNPIGWVVSAAHQTPLQPAAQPMAPVATSLPVMQGGLMFFGVPPTTLIH